MDVVWLEEELRWFRSTASSSAGNGRNPKASGSRRSTRPRAKSGHVPLRDEGRVGRRRSRGERRVREMAEDPGTSTRRNAPRGSADLSTEKGGTWSHRDHGDGEGHRRGSRRCPGSDRFL